MLKHGKLQLKESKDVAESTVLEHEMWLAEHTDRVLASVNSGLEGMAGRTTECVTSVNAELAEAEDGVKRQFLLQAKAFEEPLKTWAAEGPKMVVESQNLDKGLAQLQGSMLEMQSGVGDRLRLVPFCWIVERTDFLATQKNCGLELDHVA